MIPVRDSIRSRRFPVVTVAIIAVNVAVFVHQSSLGSAALRMFYMRYGVVPVELTLLPRFLVAGRLEIVWYLLGTLVTAMFVHGGFVHLFGNMLYLWIFGDNVEDRLGRVRYLGFYLLTGIAGTLAHVVAAPSSNIPLVGASGAIAGVMGAYLISFPRSRVLALVPLFFFFHLVEVPAVLFLAFWFLLQLVYGVGSLAPGSADVVAWWAHVGGFATGVILIRLWAGRRSPPRPRWTPQGTWRGYVN